MSNNLKVTSKTCEKCNGKCCKYVAIEIDTPEDLEDFENIRWYVAHKNINVYVDEEDKWHIEFLTLCEFLGEKNKCEIYEKRPTICREYNQDECLFHNGYEEKYTFKKLEDVDKYIREVFKRGKHVIVDDKN
ncbi:MAG: YkgJ family cysteine cluster protein [Nanoarchaeota archaeon]